MDAALVLSAMLALPGHRLDAAELPEVRAARLRPHAEGIALAALTVEHAAALVAQAHHETRWAAYVLDGRCHEGPVGERCDNGLSRGAFQVRAWCRATTPAGEAACALSQFRYGWARCGSVAGGYVALAGVRGCEWSGAAERVRTFRRVAAVLRAGGSK